MSGSSDLVVASERCPVCSAETVSTICELPSYPLTELFVPAPSAEVKGAGVRHQLTSADQVVLIATSAAMLF